MRCGKGRDVTCACCAERRSDAGAIICWIRSMPSEAKDAERCGLREFCIQEPPRRERARARARLFRGTLPGTGRLEAPGPLLHLNFGP